MAVDGTRIMVNLHKDAGNPRKRKRTHLLLVDSEGRFGDGTLGTPSTVVTTVIGSDDDVPNRKLRFTVGAVNVIDQHRMTLVITHEKIDTITGPLDGTIPLTGSLAVTITNDPTTTTTIPTTLIPVNYVDDPNGCNEIVP